MPKSPDRFLEHRTSISRKAALGRVFNVTRETWCMRDDPQLVSPRAELLVSGRTASDAADIAREAAGSFHRHGFHKPSASWWAADDRLFHRFIVHADEAHGAIALALVSGLAALAALSLSRRRRNPPRTRTKAAAHHRMPW